MHKSLRIYLTDDHGGVTLSGIPATERPYDALSKRISPVTQDDFIFMDTLCFNLKVTNVLASNEQRLTVLKLAYLDDIDIKG